MFVIDSINILWLGFKRMFCFYYCLIHFFVLIKNSFGRVITKFLLRRLHERSW